MLNANAFKVAGGIALVIFLFPFGNEPGHFDWASRLLYAVGGAIGFLAAVKVFYSRFPH